MDEFPTDNTAIRMTVFMTEGRMSMPAFWIDITNGDVDESALPPPSSCVLLYGTNRPIITRLKM